MVGGLCAFGKGERGESGRWRGVRKDMERGGGEEKRGVNGRGAGEGRRRAACGAEGQVRGWGADDGLAGLALRRHLLPRVAWVTPLLP